jgi:hypothetical protein
LLVPGVGDERRLATDRAVLELLELAVLDDGAVRGRAAGRRVRVAGQLELGRQLGAALKSGCRSEADVDIPGISVGCAQLTAA